MAGDAPPLLHHQSDNLSSLLKASWHTFIQADHGRPDAASPQHVRSESSTYEGLNDLHTLYEGVLDRMMECIFENERFQVSCNSTGIAR